MSLIFGSLYLQQMLIWLDDIFGHAETEEQLLDLLRQTFQILREQGIKLSAKKCQFFTRKATWCGREISEQGIKFSDNKITALMDLPSPLYASELLQFLSALNWMRANIPEYNRLTNVLYQLLEKCYKHVKS